MASHPTPPRRRGTPTRHESPADQVPTTANTTRAPPQEGGGQHPPSSSSSVPVPVPIVPSSAAKAKRGTRAARPTEARLQAYLSTVHPLPGSETRPTERQLRWAAFHSKSKARYTRSLVEALMAHPPAVEDVPGATEGDGDTTEESCSSSGSGSGSDGDGGGCSSAEEGDGGFGALHRATATAAAGGTSASPSSEAHSNGNLPQTRRNNDQKKKKKKRRKKRRKPGQPELSRGRRATLKVSERATDRRRRDIAKRGYRSGRGMEGGFTTFASRRQMFDSPPPPATTNASGGGSGRGGGHPAAAAAAHGAERGVVKGEVDSFSRAMMGAAEATTVHADALAEAFGEEFYSPSPPTRNGQDANAGIHMGGVVSSSPFLTSAANATPGSSGKRGANVRRTNQGRAQTASTARFTQDLDEDDEGRVKRFEAALSALKISTETTAEDPTTVKGSGKKWTRPPNVATGANQSPFFDIQRGGSYRYGSVHSPPNAAGTAAGGRGAGTFDRGASWLVHMPKVATGSADRRKGAAGAAELQDKGASWLSHVPKAMPRYKVEKGRLIISPTNANGEQVNSPELQDRAATWMEHMPNREDRLAAERAAAAASRSLKVDVTAEASRSPEKVTSPGEAKFNDIISQFHSIEAMLAAQREGEHVPSGAGGEGINRNDPVVSPAMSQMNFLQAALAANDVAAGKQRTPRGKNLLSPTSQFNAIQEKLRTKNGVVDESEPMAAPNLLSPTSQFNSIQDQLKAEGIEEEQGPGRNHLVAYFSPSPNKGRDSMDPMATAVASSGAKAAGVRLPPGRESVSHEEANLLRHEGDFDVPEAPTPKHIEGKPHLADAPRESRKAAQALAQIGDSDADAPGSAPRKGAVSSVRHMFSPGERQRKETSQESAEEPFPPPPGEESLLYGFEESPGTIPRNDGAGAINGGDIHQAEGINEHETSEFSAPTEERMNEMKNIILKEGNEQDDTGRVMIDTDGTTSDVSATDDDYAKLRLGSLMLSPTIITKRYQQAVAAIEVRNWEQVTYLLSANPWLAEMTDVRNDQYLLHKLALYGAGEANEDSDAESLSGRSATAAPEQLTLDLIEKCPAAVTKFDHEGNLPLHMAATSGNLEMIKQLGERFTSGASVQNHEGMLPLHLAVLSCAYPSGAGGSSSPSGIVRVVLDLFPGGIGVIDNEGNLPLHIAAANLSGDLGVDILFLLLDEAEKQAPNLRLCRDPRSKAKSKPEDDDDDAEEESEASDDDVNEETPFCNLVKNKDGNTPLREAIETHAGWQIIEMLIQGGGGEEAALEPDKYDGQNALHLLIRGEFADPAAVLSLLKIMPRIATYPDGEGVLPIEAACIASMPRAVILALVLVDLPVDLDDKDAVKAREGFGASWAFLTCDCDDAHIDIVEEVLSICSYRQTRELCFLRSGSGSTRNSGTVISRATPKSKAALRKALRFVGRYEFLGSSPVHSDASEGLKVFEALDFGTTDAPIQDGRPVLLKCYSNESSYFKEIAHVKNIDFDPACVEGVDYFAVHDFEAYSSANAPQQFCVAIEKPSLALARVVAGSGDYRQEPDRFHKYLTRVSMVLRYIGKAVNHLHDNGLVHGNISLLNCGKFSDRWKLMGITGAKALGEDVPTWAMSEGIPPEATILSPDQNGGLEEASVKLHETLKASPTIDAWAYGKLMYEVLVGEPLIPFDYNMEAFYNDRNALVALAAWDESTLRDVVNEVVESGAGTLAADLISHCLCPSPEDRPKSFDEILDHPFWKDQRQLRKVKKKKASNKGDKKASVKEQAPQETKRRMAV